MVNRQLTFDFDLEIVIPRIDARHFFVKILFISKKKKKPRFNSLKLNFPEFQ
jgi:hypothetical protein